MIQRYARLNGTRWLDLWHITKAKIKNNRLSYSSISSDKVANDEEQNLGEQELPPAFYHTSNPQEKLKAIKLSVKSLKRFLIPGKKYQKNTLQIEELDLEIQQMEKMLSKLQTINEVISSNEVPDECILENQIDAILSNLQATIIERNVFVRIYAESNITLYSKPRLVFIVLENLIENAVNYSSLGSSQSYIEVNLKKEGHDLVVCVEDNGVGIRKEACDKIFNMFYKDSEQSKGGGLGLYIVREALQKLEGKIGFESEVGCFTRIEVHIPASQVPKDMPEKYVQEAVAESIQSV
ncbi:sensor histidine kinase [Catalinimonas niigatensis]|uniref:sensor histidine kinase n=1 Tax=Catalinimonas niigatensis TaxID=1397264 RepID=UPI002665AC45|nr:HAMP domain-containing sensor histidine kinase [Catalinimonas niigatensis]WPP51414.1 HAMP domain-containing sensor histidine kinase [Catalinimonas niigatensis]